MKRIVLIDDSIASLDELLGLIDPSLQRTLLERKATHRFEQCVSWVDSSSPLPDKQILLFDCESTFHQHLSKLALQPPDVVVSDGLLPWTTPYPGRWNPPPPEIIQDGAHRAGIRCLVAAREAFPASTVLCLHTIEPPDSDSALEGIRVLQKGARTPRRPTIRALLGIFGDKPDRLVPDLGRGTATSSN